MSLEHLDDVTIRQLHANAITSLAATGLSQMYEEALVEVIRLRTKLHAPQKARDDERSLRALLDEEVRIAEAFHRDAVARVVFSDVRQAYDRLQAAKRVRDRHIEGDVV